MLKIVVVEQHSHRFGDTRGVEILRRLTLSRGGGRSLPLLVGLQLNDEHIDAQSMELAYQQNNRCQSIKSRIS